jgi:hypothetical protein
MQKSIVGWLTFVAVVIGLSSTRAQKRGILTDLDFFQIHDMNARG